MQAYQKYGVKWSRRRIHELSDDLISCLLIDGTIMAILWEGSMVQAEKVKQSFYEGERNWQNAGSQSRRGGEGLIPLQRSQSALQAQNQSDLWQSTLILGPTWII